MVDVWRQIPIFQPNTQQVWLQCVGTAVLQRLTAGATREVRCSACWKRRSAWERMWRAGTFARRTSKKMCESGWRRGAKRKVESRSLWKTAGRASTAEIGASKLGGCRAGGRETKTRTGRTSGTLGDVPSRSATAMPRLETEKWPTNPRTSTSKPGRWRSLDCEINLKAKVYCKKMTPLRFKALTWFNLGSKHAQSTRCR